MINTVLGKISADRLGITLMHEHIIWDWSGADKSEPEAYDGSNIVSSMLPYLINLKKCGCDTLVEATPRGAGRHVKILEECSRKSGLNIITNTGVWDGGSRFGFFVPEDVRTKDINYIVDSWEKEYINGIENTDIRPGFIKIALGDTGELTALHEKLLIAATRTSLRTGLPIQAHIISNKSIVKAVGIAQEQGLPLNKFIWIHGDAEQNLSRIIEIMEKGVWVEFDCLQRVENLAWHIAALKRVIEVKLTDRILFSQDGGTFYIGLKDEQKPFLPYDKLFKEIIPIFKEQGITDEVIKIILKDNPAKVLDCE